MPYIKKDHEACRKLVCVLCWGAAGKKASRGVSKAEEAAIKEFVVSSYSKSDPRFPSGLCTDCHFILGTWMRGAESPRPLPMPESYQAILLISTRSMGECSCKICYMARLNGQEWRSFVSSLQASQKPLNKNSDRLCANCFSRIFPGNHHTAEVCRSRVQVVENLSSVNPEVLEKVVHSHLTNTVQESGEKTIKLTGVSGGKSSTVTMGPPIKQSEPCPLTTKEILDIQSEANLSDTQMISVLKNLRLKCGWKAVETNVRAALTERKGIFAKYFSVEMTTFLDSDDKPFQSPFVFCSDLVGFVETLAYLRGFNFTDMAQKIGMDSGKGHLRMVLTMYDEEDIIPVNNKPRITRMDGIGAGTSYRLTGRRKIMILASAPKVPENHHNCSIFIDKVNINSLVYKFTGDLKLYNIVGGLMSGSAKHPCIYCEAAKEDGKWQEDAPLRTLRNIQQHVDDWQTSGGDRKKAKMFSNCVQSPLLASGDDNPDTPMLLMTVPPALHLKLAINHFLKELAKVWPEVLDWLTNMHIALEPYHGGQTLEGNEASKVLKNLDLLADIIPSPYVPFLDCLYGLRDTIDSAFGFTLDPFYEDVIQHFQQSFEKLRLEFGVSETTKLHIMFNHVGQFIKMTGKPLGEFSEQELENSHSAFEHIWDRYRVKDVSSQTYLLNYYRAVLNFNANNI